ncbi:MAG: hypothetical protein ACRDVE_13790 [Actinocrinis sp.]
MSQLPEMPAGWPEQGYDPSAYPQQGEAQPAQGAAGQQPYAQTQAVQWQQDTEPDWGASQGYANQGGGGYQQGFNPQQHSPQQQAAAEQEGEQGLPDEFDHLFRDSTPDSRRPIDRQKPAVGNANAGYLNGQAEAAAAAAPPADQSGAAPQPGYQVFQQFPQQADQYQQGGYQGQGQEQYQGGGYQNGGGQYGQPEYAQGGGYGNGNGFDNGGYDSGGGYGPGGLGEQLRSRRKWVIGGAVALIAVVGIVLAVSKGGGSPSGSPAANGSSATASSSSAAKLTPKQQADAIYQIIQQSSQLRSDASTGVVDVKGCKDLGNAQTLLSTTAQKRQAQADNVAKLNVAGIRNGAELAGQLKAAWAASSQADGAYASIAGDLQGGCKSTDVKKDSNYQASQDANSAASNAKVKAAKLWNENVAGPLGEPQIESSQL